MPPFSASTIYAASTLRSFSQMRGISYLGFGRHFAAHSLESSRRSHMRLSRACPACGAESKAPQMPARRHLADDEAVA